MMVRLMIVSYNKFCILKDWVVLIEGVLSYVYIDGGIYILIFDVCLVVVVMDC